MFLCLFPVLCMEGSVNLHHAGRAYGIWVCVCVRVHTGSVVLLAQLSNPKRHRRRDTGVTSTANHSHNYQTVFTSLAVCAMCLSIHLWVWGQSLHVKGIVLWKLNQLERKEQEEEGGGSDQKNNNIYTVYELQKLRKYLPWCLRTPVSAGTK